MTGPSEESPLLARVSQDEVEEVLQHEKVYNRFSIRQKRAVVAIVSCAGLIPLFVSGCIVPAIPQIARELGTTGSIVNLSVSLSMVSAAITNMLWATYSGYYGRRPIFLVSLPFLCAGSLGVALCWSIPTLMMARVVQAFGAASGMSVGAGVIGDIYKLEERGTAMGLFFGTTLLGAALAPLAGGAMTHYASWRDIHYALFCAGLLVFVCTLLYLPETSHPGTRGVDKASLDADSTKWKWVWLNPFACLALLRAPNLFAVTLAGTFVLLTDYVLLIPLSYTIGARYGITNEALVGAFFIAAGTGNMSQSPRPWHAAALGAPIAGRISDYMVTKSRKQRGGEWVPEDRLRATLTPALLLVPCSVLFSGLTTHFVDGRPGIVLNLLCLFMNGIGVDLVLSPIAAYLVDVMHGKSAQLMAAHNMLWATIEYGERMRAWLDVGYSIARDN
ncbi:MFS general substrate transporter [Amylocystis lapponica]|nr:MFS general substrate transporter [Amylocystis lapponica]